MSETPTLYESSTNEHTFGPDFSTSPTSVQEPVEVKPVSWDGPNDPKNPQNWSAWKKWMVMSVTGIVTVNVCVLRVVLSAVTN